MSWSTSQLLNSGPVSPGPPGFCAQMFTNLVARLHNVSESVVAMHGTVSCGDHAHACY